MVQELKAHHADRDLLRAARKANGRRRKTLKCRDERSDVERHRILLEARELERIALLHLRRSASEPRRSIRPTFQHRQEPGQMTPALLPSRVVGRNPSGCLRVRPDVRADVHGRTRWSPCLRDERFPSPLIDLRPVARAKDQRVESQELTSPVGFVSLPH